MSGGAVNIFNLKSIESKHFPEQVEFGKLNFSLPLVWRESIELV